MVGCVILLSKMADYAVVVAVALAQAEARAAARPLTAGQLAEATRLAAPTVAKVLKMLVHGGLVASARGPAGGYGLARPAERISVGQVVAAIDGPFAITECGGPSGGPAGGCEREGFCATRPHWRRINQAVSAALEAVTLAEMAPPSFAMPPIERRARGDGEGARHELSGDAVR